MKNYKVPVMGFVLVLLITSCRKEDVQQNSSKTTSATDIKGSWSSFSNWSTVKANDSSNTYFSEILDTAINAAVAKSGLVLVYKKEGSTIKSLPFEDKFNGTYWYYQISKGVLRVDGTDNGPTQKNFNGQAFSYFVFTPERISALQQQGKSKFDLLQLSYDQAVQLSK
jgi:hypothetical protein